MKCLKLLETVCLIAVAVSVSSAHAKEAVVADAGGRGGVDSPSAVKMVLGPSSAATSNADTVSWKGCEGGFKIGRSNNRGQVGCGDVPQMDRGFATAIGKAVPYCFSKSNDAIVEIKVDHIGCFANRNKRVPGGRPSGKSEHAFGRAIDLRGIQVRYASGATEALNFNLTASGKRAVGSRDPSDIDEFRKCWSDAISGRDPEAARAMGLAAGQRLCRSHKRQNKVVGSIWSSKSALSPKNHLHDDHLHLECL